LMVDHLLCPDTDAPLFSLLSLYISYFIMKLWL
jgi:hypothetical protein